MQQLLLTVRALDHVMELLDQKRHIARVTFWYHVAPNSRCTRSIVTGLRRPENILPMVEEDGKAPHNRTDSFVDRQEFHRHCFYTLLYLIGNSSDSRDLWS